MHFRTGGPSPNSKQFNEAISHSTPSVRGPNEGANLSPFNGSPPPPDAEFQSDDRYLLCRNSCTRRPSLET